jgi:hypothetical protein
MTDLGRVPTPFGPPSGPPFGPPVAQVVVRRDPLTPLPLQAAIAAIVVTAVSLTASKFLIEWLVEYRWPIAV